MRRTRVGTRASLTTAAPILAEYGVPWSAFIVSDWAEGRHTFTEDVMLTWREIEKLAAAGQDSIKTAFEALQW